jgi:hypothetical protein
MSYIAIYVTFLMVSVISRTDYGFRPTDPFSVNRVGELTSFGDFTESASLRSTSSAPGTANHRPPCQARPPHQQHPSPDRNGCPLLGTQLYLNIFLVSKASGKDVDWCWRRRRSWPASCFFAGLRLGRNDLGALIVVRVHYDNPGSAWI